MYKLIYPNDLVVLYTCFIVMVTGKCFMNYQSNPLTFEESHDAYAQRRNVNAFYGHQEKPVRGIYFQ